MADDEVRKLALEIARRQFPSLPPIPSSINSIKSVSLPPITVAKSPGISLQQLFRPKTTQQLIKRIEEDTLRIIRTQINTSKAFKVPEITDVSHAEAKTITTSVLHIDMRGSTNIIRQFNAVDALKIYKIFHATMVSVALFKGGKVRTFAGDRIGVLFDPSRSVDDAVETALLMQGVIEQILNPIFQERAGYSIQYGIGVDYGIMLVGRIGQYGNSNNDLVWVGEAMNVASKLADDMGAGVFISDTVHSNMSSKIMEDMNMLWKQSVDVKLGTVHEFIGIPLLPN